MRPLVLDKRDQIIAACRQYAGARLDVFGSAARGADFDPSTSDVDFGRGVKDQYLDLKDAFERIRGRRVDLVDRQAIMRSRNYIRRRHILDGASAFYAARQATDVVV